MTEQGDKRLYLISGERMAKRKKKPWTRHGLTWEECKAIAEVQNWKCPILGTPLELDEENKKILDKDPCSKKVQWACVDHDHHTNEIRGLLSDMGNMLLGGWERGRYGSDMEPSPTWVKYVESRLAQTTVGVKLFF
jgi:hypothetical protein